MVAFARRFNRSQIVYATLLALGLGVVGYGFFFGFVGVRSLKNELTQFGWIWLILALALALVHYFVRFLKWQLYLRTLAIRVALRDSLLIYLSSYSLAVTPGKLGDLIKAYFLYQRRAVPVEQTSSIIVAERVTDLAALLLLSLVGVSSFLKTDAERRLLVVTFLLCIGFLLFATAEGLVEKILNLLERTSWLNRIVPRLRLFHRSIAVLIKPRIFTMSMLLSVGAWFLECVCCWSIVRGFAVGSASLALCTFIYSATTIAGALSFLPGGLIVQEAAMAGLLMKLATNMPLGRAAAVTFLTRLCTLWFAVLIGLAALALLSRVQKNQPDRA